MKFFSFIFLIISIFFIHLLLCDKAGNDKVIKVKEFFKNRSKNRISLKNSIECSLVISAKIYEDNKRLEEKKTERSSFENPKCALYNEKDFFTTDEIFENCANCEFLQCKDGKYNFISAGITYPIVEYYISSVSKKLIQENVSLQKENIKNEEQLPTKICSQSDGKRMKDLAKNNSPRVVKKIFERLILTSFRRGVKIVLTEEQKYALSRTSQVIYKLLGDINNIGSVSRNYTPYLSILGEYFDKFYNKQIECRGLEFKKNMPIVPLKYQKHITFYKSTLHLYNIHVYSSGYANLQLIYQKFEEIYDKSFDIIGNNNFDLDLLADFSRVYSNFHTYLYYRAHLISTIIYSQLTNTVLEDKISISNKMWVKLLNSPNNLQIFEKNHVRTGLINIYAYQKNWTSTKVETMFEDFIYVITCNEGFFVCSKDNAQSSTLPSILD
ncbi:hypothetical protein EDEG_02287 [Edhazardia aedis USNM 41457]|uniref:Uncharacterized protein n=1 Tax=Edhazardia aedis (strain USNM 41457) TaxID=1003232 RepID=J9DPS9_EDHAE|nr:hypothetical protein EDEG_02287 [Edhazardia aedis USNM 41457]|eukprot:EJW03377.1 hypothetical protein EDEG_02287 [Edhazardia aedis USNM 41457]